MKRNNLITILFPALIMILISIISFMDISHIDLKGLFIISIVALFPLVILIQGIFVASNNTNIILALLTSILTFIAVMFILMKTFEIIYIQYYTISFIIWYLISKILIKLKLLKLIKIGSVRQLCD